MSLMGQDLGHPALETVARLDSGNRVAKDGQRRARLLHLGLKEAAEGHQAFEDPLPPLVTE
jgi:hypothetical protein